VDVPSDLDLVAALLCGVYGVLVDSFGTPTPWWTPVEVARAVVLSPTLSTTLRAALPPTTTDIQFEWSGYVVMTVIEVRAGPLPVAPATFPHVFC
jgi:hypothetical protein